MKLSSSKSQYGIRAMLVLASNGNGEPVSINTISKRENISAYYLEQLFIFLKNGNLVKSTRGIRGGYMLAKSPDKITVGEIFRLLEGPIEITDYEDETKNNYSSNHIAKVLWEKLKESIEKVLDSITLQDILNDYKNDYFFNNVQNLDRSDINEDKIFG